MGHVFISYARSDARLVRRLVTRLESAGCTVWIDREDIPGGSGWAGKIVDAIEASAAVLVALSPRSVESAHVRKEASIAVDAKKLVLPVWIERGTISGELRYHLAGVEQLDLEPDFDAGFDRLLVVLRPILQGELDAILEDPDLTTVEKIEKWVKVRSSRKHPIDAGLEEVANERTSVDDEIGALEREKRELVADGVKPDARALQRITAKLQELEQRRSALDEKHRTLVAERAALFERKTAETLKSADDLVKRYDRIIDRIVKKP